MSDDRRAFHSNNPNSNPPLYYYTRPRDTNDDNDDNYGLNERRYRRESFRRRPDSHPQQGFWSLREDVYGDGHRPRPPPHTYENNDAHDLSDNEDIAGEATRLRYPGAEDIDLDYDDDEADLAAKHRSADSSNSAAHLLSGDPVPGPGPVPGAQIPRQQINRGLPAALGGLAGLGGSLRAGKRRQERQQPLLGEFQSSSPYQNLGVPPPQQPLQAQDVTRDRPGGRIVSGARLEEGPDVDMRMRHRGGAGGPEMLEGEEKPGAGGGGAGGGGNGGFYNGSATGSSRTIVQRPFWKRKKWYLGIVILLAVLAVIVVPVVVVMTRRHQNQGHSKSAADADDDKPANTNLQSISRDSIPQSAKGTDLDPFSWYDTTDFNVTYTDETVGDLPLMGLNSTWDDSTRANEHVPPLNESFPYGSQPVRGVNLGGWLSLEPFIVPSLFDQYDPSEGIVDEWTLTTRLGPDASSTLEKHYAKFITEQDIKEIRDAGLDHVRIQYSYWAVKTYSPREPYVKRIAWRYLLRAIEYCRKYGLRVNLDLHGLVGSQNGWNHSGHEGTINWLNGTDGALNRNRSLEMHDQLSKFFAQDRYKNIVTFYGLVNEPLMLNLPVKDVLDWTTDATRLVQSNNITAWIVFHDGFLNLSKWKKMLKGDDVPDKMILDTHQYTIFNTGQIVLKHRDRLNLICNDWWHMIREINTTSAGYGPPCLPLSSCLHANENSWGPTMSGEWSQADTDCAKYLNNVGRGTRWEGTMSTTDSTPYCPVATGSNGDGFKCSCAKANAPPATYSDNYKKYLQTYAEAQMSAFETAFGWFYWTWRTESAAQWSYRTAWKNGYMPAKAYAPAFRCGDPMPDFGDLEEFY